MCFLFARENYENRDSMRLCVPKVCLKHSSWRQARRGLEMVAIATNRRLLGMLALLGASRSATPIAVGTGTSVRQGFALPVWHRRNALRACGRRCIGLPRTRGTCSDWI